MKRVGVAALCALLMSAAGCTPGVQLHQAPLDSSARSSRIQDLSMAINGSPGNPKYYVQRAQAFEANGEYKSALADLNQAMTLRPAEAKYRFLRGIAYAYGGDDESAKQDFERAEQMDPGSAESYNARAWLWATAPDASMRDGKKAIDAATKACQMTNWQEPDFVGTLAAAYAETGDFDQAIKWQQKSVDLTPQTLLSTYNERYARLELYRSHKPWRPAPPLHPLTTS